MSIEKKIEDCPFCEDEGCCFCDHTGKIHIGHPDSFFQTVQQYNDCVKGIRNKWDKFLIESGLAISTEQTNKSVKEQG